MNQPVFKHGSETKEGRLERAMAVLKSPHGLVAQKIQFLQSKGMDMTEILEVLNKAGNGALLEAVGI